MPHEGHKPRASQVLLNRIIQAGEKTQTKLINKTPQLALFGDTGFVCFCIRAKASIRLVHETDEVHAMVRRLIVDIWPDAPLVVSGKYGALQFNIPNASIKNHRGQDRVFETGLKKFLARLIEEMHRLGYDFIASTDLARFDQSSWIFQKVSDAARERSPVVSVSPKGHNSLELYHWESPELVQQVRHVIANEWNPHIDEIRDAKDTEFCDFKLQGSPWKEDNGVRTRTFLTRLVTTMSRNGFQLLQATNVDGGPSTFFFMTTQQSRSQGTLGFISPHCHSYLKMRDIDFTTKERIKARIQAFYQDQPISKVEETSQSGAVQLYIPDKPFLTHPGSSEFKQARNLMCHILSELRNCGWECICTFDVDRSIDEKTNFMFRRVAQTSGSRYISVSLSDSNRLIIINATNEQKQALLQAFSDHYSPGMKQDSSTGDMVLQGDPWNKASAFGLHGQTAMVFLLKFAIESLGMRLAASADVSSKFIRLDEVGNGYPADVHSWFLEKL